MGFLNSVCPLTRTQTRGVSHLYNQSVKFYYNSEPELCLEQMSAYGKGFPNHKSKQRVHCLVCSYNLMHIRITFYLQKQYQQYYAQHRLYYRRNRILYYCESAVFNLHRKIQKISRQKYNQINFVAFSYVLLFDRVCMFLSSIQIALQPSHTQDTYKKEFSCSHAFQAVQIYLKHQTNQKTISSYLRASYVYQCIEIVQVNKKVASHFIYTLHGILNQDKY